MGNEVSGPSTYVKDFQVRLGPFSVMGKLVNLKRKAADKEAKFHMISPNNKPVQQVWQEEGTGSLFAYADCGRAKLVDKKLVPVSAEEIEAAKKSDLPSNLITLSVHPADQVNKVNWHADNTYVFVPTHEDEYYGTLFKLLSDSKKAYMGLCNLHNNEGLFRLSAWGSMIIVEKMLYPEDVSNLELPVVPVNKELLELGKAMVDKVTTNFVSESYVNTVRAKLAAIQPAVEEDPVAPKKKKLSVSPPSDLIAQLKAMLEEKEAVNQ